MASVTVTETEATHLVVDVPAQDAKGPGAAAFVEIKTGTGGPAWIEEVDRGLLSPAWLEKVDRLVGVAPRPPPAKQSLLSRLTRLWRRYFVPFDPYSIPVNQPLSEEQLEMLQRAMSMSLLQARCTGMPIFTMAFAGFMGTSWLVRSALLDSFCKTCYSRFDVPHPGIQKIFACGHKHVQKVCEMCYRRSCVLHPGPGGFAFGYHDPYRPYPTKH